MTPLLLVVLWIGMMTDLDVRIDENLCGFHALAVIARQLRESPDRTRLESLLPPARAPFSLHEIGEAAQKLGFRTYAIHWTEPAVAAFECPAILHVKRDHTSREPDHFVACVGQVNGSVCLIDFPRDPVMVEIGKLCEWWQGDALLIENSTGSVIPSLQRSRNLRRMANIALSLLSIAGILWLVSGFARKTNLGRQLTARAKRNLMNWSPFSILLFLLLVGGCATRAPGKLVADKTQVDIAARNISNNKHVVSFELRNTGAQQLTILSEATSCSCILLTDLSGHVLRPGEKCQLKAEISVPEMGLQTQSVRITHDSSDEPLILKIRIEGRQVLPIVGRGTPAVARFLQLRSADETAELTVQTYERTGSTPWLGDLQCDHPLITADVIDFGESHLFEGVIERRYVFRIGWRALPEETEFIAGVRASTKYGIQKEVSVGQVLGSLASPLVSPRLVKLSPTTYREDSVIFESGVIDHSWELDENAEIPPWLIVQWRRVDDVRLLHLALSEQSTPDQESRFLLPLKSDHDEIALPVRFLPNTNIVPTH